MGYLCEQALALSCEYVCRTGPFDHSGASFATAAEAQAAAQARYDAAGGGEAAEAERLVSGSDDFTLFLWSPTAQKQPLARLAGHQQLVNHIAFSPDGRFIAWARSSHLLARSSWTAARRSIPQQHPRSTNIA